MEPSGRLTDGGRPEELICISEALLSLCVLSVPPLGAGLVDIVDLEFTPRGVRVQLRRSKTDQEALGRPFGVPYGVTPETCPVQATLGRLTYAY